MTELDGIKNIEINKKCCLVDSNDSNIFRKYLSYLKMLGIMPASMAKE